MNNQKHVSLLVIGVLVGAVIYIAEIAEPAAVAVYGQNTENFTSNFSNYNSTTTQSNQSSGTTQSNQSSGTASPLSSLLIDHAGGGFTSLQTDNDNKTWIATGDWDLDSEPSGVNQSNSSVINFNATVNMRGTDNSDGHEHKISEFKLTSSSIGSSQEGSVIVFNGTAAIETDVGLYTDVPVTIKIFDEGPTIVSIDTQTNEIKPQWIPKGGTISVLIDERVEDHFGNTPIYGNVKRE